MQDKITKSEFARRAGINPSTATRVCRTILAAAFAGKRIDAAHPDAVSYMQNKALQQTEPVAPGIDSMYPLAVEHCQESGIYSISAIQRKLRIGYNRASKIVEAMKASGLVPEKPTAQQPAPEPQAPKLRGNAAANQTKKSAALAEANARRNADINDGMIHEIPDDIEAFLDMTLRELVQRFGTDVAFIDWLKSTKMIEDINEKRLKNAQTKGELISRKLVKDHVIDTFNSAHLRLMKDVSKSIAAGVVSKAKGGATLPEIEACVSDVVGSFIKPIKNKISRVLKNA